MNVTVKESVNSESCLLSKVSQEWTRLHRDWELIPSEQGDWTHTKPDMWGKHGSSKLPTELLPHRHQGSVVNCLGTWVSKDKTSSHLTPINSRPFHRVFLRSKLFIQARPFVLSVTMDSQQTQPRPTAGGDISYQPLPEGPRPGNPESLYNKPPPGTSTLPYHPSPNTYPPSSPPLRGPNLLLIPFPARTPLLHRTTTSTTTTSAPHPQQQHQPTPPTTKDHPTPHPRQRPQRPQPGPNPRAPNPHPRSAPLLPSSPPNNQQQPISQPTPTSTPHRNPSKPPSPQPNQPSASWWRCTGSGLW